MKLIQVLGKLEEKADKRRSQMEERRIRLEAELKEKGRKEDRKHDYRCTK